MYYVGIDLGGTNIAVGVVNDNGNVITKMSVPTQAERPIEEIVADMAGCARTCMKDAGIMIKDVAWVGVGCPGTIDTDAGVVEYSNNIKMKHVPMRNMLSDLLDGVEVYIENDANAAAWGEYCAGAAKGTKNAVAITLGTGVGGGVIIDGKLYSGSNYAGGELGHTVIEYDGRQCTCGRKGCFEAYASATGLANITKDNMKRQRNSAMWRIVDNDIENVGGKTAFDAMRLGDEAGIQTVNEYIGYLACGITNIINIFQPEVVTISGGISKEGDGLIKPLNAIIEKERYSKYCDRQTKVIIAALGSDAGVIGAALLGRLHK